MTRADEIAVPDDAVEIALLPEAREPFADRRAAHAVLDCEPDFGKRRAGPISSFDDAGFEVAVRALDMRRVARDARVEDGLSR